MKNIFLFILGLAFILGACNPNEEIYEELDALQPEKPIAELTIRLTVDEYKLSPLSEKFYNFGSMDDAKVGIPEILVQLHPELGDGSLANVTFDLYRGSSDAVKPYTYANSYEISDADYEALGGDAADYKLFTKNQAPQYNISSILGNTLTEGVEEGDIVLVKFRYADEVVDPSVNQVLDNPEYQSVVDHIKVEKGTDWIDSYGTLEYYYGANSYFKNFEGRVYKWKQWRTDNGLVDDLFEGSTTDEEDSLRVEGRIQEGLVKFLELTYPNATSQINGVDKFFTLSYKVYYGSAHGTITYNVQYQSDDAGSFVLVQDPTTDDIPSSSISEDRGMYYTFNGGEWKFVGDDVYYLSSADYDAMGAPGYYDNFSSSVSPDNYVPALLAQRYPYAQEEDVKIVTYKYYSSSSGVKVRGNEYTFLNGKWNPYSSVSETSLGFGIEEGVWVPDNTIKYVLTDADYELVGNGYYKNFDVRSGKDEAEESVRIEKIGTILKHNFPDSEEGQKYLVEYKVYSGAAEIWQTKVILENGEYIKFVK